MDQAHIVITAVKALQLPKVEIETNEGKRYISDLSEFKNLYCFPKDQKQWKDLSITASGFNITWGTRFEVHVHQIIDSATSQQKIQLRA
jgi:hypothetical protein